jgi:hypothetical protein
MPYQTSVKLDHVVSGHKFQFKDGRLQAIPILQPVIRLEHHHVFEKIPMIAIEIPPFRMGSMSEF